MTGFENQLKTELERGFFLLLEIKTRCIKTMHELNNVFVGLLRDNPAASELDWVEPLRLAILDLAGTGTEFFSVHDYVESIERRYKGTALLLGDRQVIGLSAFTANELKAPHLQWVKELDRKIHGYREIFPDLNDSGAVTMAKYSTLKELSDQELYELYKEFSSHECPYNTSMNFSSWVEWYEGSKAYFDGEGNVIPELSKQMLKTLTAWKDQSLEENKYWLCRNYEIHPSHEKIITPWIIESRKSMGSDKAA
ncbi:hypothetical protein LCS82_08520 [Vibrio harveyi]|uniref:hypothetical protein n=1 Tax=Vibrio harveyi TaxID=669 RepID=UPI003BB700F4